MIWLLTVFLGLIGLLFLAGYLYYDILRLPKLEIVTKTNFFIASSLFFFFGVSLILILLIWNSLARNFILELLLINVLISFLAGSSAVSPYTLAQWWAKIGKR